MNSLVVQRQSGGCINPGVIENAVIQLAVVNWRGKAVKIRDEQIDIKISRAALRHVDNRQNGAKIIANVNIVVGAHASEDDGFTHKGIIAEYSTIGTPFSLFLACWHGRAVESTKNHCTQS